MVVTDNTLQQLPEAAETAAPVRDLPDAMLHDESHATSHDSSRTTSHAKAHDARSFDKDWDGYAATIADRKQTPEWAVLREARVRHYRRFFDIRPGQCVLDAGCGHGEYTAYAARDGARVWAFDFAEKMVACTRQMLHDEGLRTEEVRQASVTDIPHPDNTFDAVFCLAVLDHVPDFDRALRELVRVLKPGGTIYLDVPNALSIHWRLCFAVMRMLGMYPGGKIRFFAPWQLPQAVRRMECRPKSASGLTFSPPYSGLYTTDLQRITFLPDWLIRPLDRLYLSVERIACHWMPLRWFCWHYFLRATKPADRGATS